jgi:hypothetical protein
MAQTHLLELCPYIPSKIRNDLIRLRDDVGKKRKSPKEKSLSGGGKHFWASTAAVLGIYEDSESEVLRFEPCWAERVVHHFDEERELQQQLDNTSVSTISTFQVPNDMCI